MSWQHEGLMRAVDYFDKIILERLEKESVSTRDIQKRETVTAYLFEALRDHEEKITYYTSFNPERIQIDIEKLYNGVRKELLKLSRQVSREPSLVCVHG